MKKLMKKLISIVCAITMVVTCITFNHSNVDAATEVPSDVEIKVGAWGLYAADVEWAGYSKMEYEHSGGTSLDATKIILAHSPYGNWNDVEYGMYARLKNYLSKFNLMQDESYRLRVTMDIHSDSVDTPNESTNQNIILANIQGNEYKIKISSFGDNKTFEAESTFDYDTFVENTGTPSGNPDDIYFYLGGLMTGTDITIKSVDFVVDNDGWVPVANTDTSSSSTEYTEAGAFSLWSICNPQYGLYGKMKYKYNGGDQLSDTQIKVTHGTQWDDAWSVGAQLENYCENYKFSEDNIGLVPGDEYTATIKVKSNKKTTEDSNGNMKTMTVFISGQKYDFPLTAQPGVENVFRVSTDEAFKYNSSRPDIVFNFDYLEDNTELIFTEISFEPVEEGWIRVPNETQVRTGKWELFARTGASSMEGQWGALSYRTKENPTSLADTEIRVRSSSGWHGAWATLAILPNYLDDKGLEIGHTYKPIITYSSNKATTTNESGDDRTVLLSIDNKSFEFPLQQATNKTVTLDEFTFEEENHEKPYDAVFNLEEVEAGTNLCIKSVEFQEVEDGWIPIENDKLTSVGSTGMKLYANWNESSYSWGRTSYKYDNPSVTNNYRKVTIKTRKTSRWIPGSSANLVEFSNLAANNMTVGKTYKAKVTVLADRSDEVKSEDDTYSEAFNDLVIAVDGSKTFSFEHLPDNTSTVLQTYPFIYEGNDADFDLYLDLFTEGATIKIQNIEFEETEYPTDAPTTTVVPTTTPGTDVDYGKWSFTQGGKYTNDQETEWGNVGYINSVVMKGSYERLDSWMRGDGSRDQTQSAILNSNGFDLDIESNGWDRNFDTNPWRIMPWSIKTNVNAPMNPIHRYKVTFKAKASKKKYAYIGFSTDVDGHEMSPYDNIEGELLGDKQYIVLGPTEKTFTYEFPNYVGGVELKVNFMFGAFGLAENGHAYDYYGNDISDIVTEEESSWNGTVSVSDFKIVDLDPDMPTIAPTTEQPTTQVPTVQPTTQVPTDAPTVAPTTEPPVESTTPKPTVQPTTQAPTEPTTNNEIEELRQQIEQLEESVNEQITSLNEQITNLKSQLSTLKAQLEDGDEELNNRIDALDSQIASMETQLDNINLSIADIENDVNNNAVSIEELQSEMAEVEDELDRLDSRITTTKTEVEATVKAYVDGQVEQINGEINTINNSINGLSALIGTLPEGSSVQSEIEDLQSDIEEIQGQLSSVDLDQIAKNKQQLQALTTQMLEITNTISQTLLSEIQNRTNEISRLEGVISGINDSLTEADEELQSQVDALDASLQTANNDIENINQQLVLIQGSIDTNATNIQQNAEDIQTLVGQLNDCAEELATVDARIQTARESAVSTAKAYTDQEISEVNALINSLNALIGAVPEGTNIQAEIVDIQNNVQAIENELDAVDLDQIERNRQQLVALENRMLEITNTISQNLLTETANRINDTTRLTNTINGINETLTAKDTDLQNQVNTLNSQLQSANEDIESINNTIVEIQNDISTNATNIGKNASDIQSLVERLSEAVAELNTVDSRIQTAKDDTLSLAKSYTDQKMAEMDDINTEKFNKQNEEIERLNKEILSLKMSSGSTSVNLSYASASNVSLSWNKHPYADGYEVYVMKPGNSQYELISDTKATALSYSIARNLSYKFMVKTYMIDSKSKAKVYGVDSNEVTANVVAPAKVVLKKVKARKKKCTVQWNSVPNAVGYQINYKQKKAKTITVKGNQLSKVINKLKKKKKVTVKVRAFAVYGTDTLYGAWSSAKKAKIK